MMVNQTRDQGLKQSLEPEAGHLSILTCLSGQIRASFSFTLNIRTLLLVQAADEVYKAGEIGIEAGLENHRVLALYKDYKLNIKVLCSNNSCKHDVCYLCFPTVNL